ncbi:endonuclease/exonuclease/phosphatase family protein [Gleimia hominis]|uniref:Endonuclease/exonuclease/phosphatase family protein n=1 Tax=Gleimia hominis TaxID=595468 RepID=A0ABU3ICP2_9ACTO|nr:endonuclease/exonuclease/phosphatase family protein [Gleimia hominis]MDT3768149.1 endonuclease/exonuclease/phosphatase family protein [Gleimia hominis]
MKHTAKILSVFLLGLLAMAAISAMVAKSLHISLLVTTWPVAAHLLAFPSALCVLLCSTGLAVAAISCWWKRKNGAIQRFWIVCAAASVVSGLLYGALAVEPAPRIDSGQTQQSDITVFEWNAHDSADVDQFEEIFKRFDPDILVLPELGDYPTPGGTRLSNLLNDAGEKSTDYSIFTSQSQGGIAPLTVMIKKSLGEYTVQDTDLATYGSLILTPSTPNSALPVIIGVHTAPPLPGLMDSWRSDLKRIQSHLSSSDHKRAIITGDFNAQLHHGALASLTHYHEVKPCTLGGTWPRSAPPVFRSQIDHILTPDTVSVRATQFYETKKSDHIALVSTLSF